ncbi:MAG: glycosyltransferase family 4 protein [Alphaproteobacteria bacterium]|nr:glycosyltransferase family 4 protein [Alphaproteobacteria bacterium]
MPPQAPASGEAAPVILQVLPELVTGGVERGTVDIAGAIVQAGGRSLVASEGGRMAGELQRVGAEHITLPLATKSPFAIRRNARRLAEVIRANGVDIVHARSRAPAWSALFASRRTGAHFVTTFHGTYNLGPPFKKLYNSVMTRGERVIAISQFIADHMVKTYKTDPAKIRVIYRGVDMDIFDPQKVPAVRVIQLANQWRLPDGIPVVLLPARLTRWKGQTLLIEALARLRDGNIRCLLVGDDQGRTKYRRALERLVHRRNLDSVVHIVGECSDMPAAYKLADVVVSASTDPEAFGRVMVEAQAMGKPVIGAAHGASSELILPDRTGWLFEPGNVEQLAGALSSALSLDTGAREQLSNAAIANVQARFSKTRMCHDTLNLYREILAPGAAASA